MTTTDLAARVDRKVSRTDGCWLWTGAPGANGYGRISVGNELKYAHRVAYELWVGPIPDGLTIDHLCRVRLCVRPDHLDAVTRAENSRREATFHRKPFCPRGHLFDERNTGINKCSGKRYCRACARERMRRRYETKAA